MSYWDALFLGIFQGVTEFLPISSSGHLVLAEHFLSLSPQGLVAFDAVLHGGSFISLVVLLWPEIKEMFGVIFSPRSASDESKKLFLFLAIGTIPTVLFGVFFEEFFVSFRTPFFVLLFFLVSAGMFFVAELFLSRMTKQASLPNTLNRKAIFLMSIFQIFALLPGISRSGIVTVAGVFSGYSRAAATRFSFLLGVPLIFGVFLFSVIRMASGEYTSLPVSYAAIGFLASAITGFFVARFLLSFFQDHSLTGFAVYLVVASGGALLFSLV